MSNLRIHFASANAVPEAPLTLDVEMRSIQEKLTQGNFHPRITSSMAARVKDLLNDLQREKPSIVHFSSHGSPTGHVILFDSQNRAKAISRKVFQELFQLSEAPVRLVVLSTCYSVAQAKQLAKLVDCVIGVAGVIGEPSALIYAEHLYDKLIRGKSVHKAHTEAIFLLRADGVPEVQWPVLHTRQGLDAAQVYFGRSPHLRATESAGGGRATAKKPRMKLVAASALKSKQELFEQERARCGVSAEAFWVRKRCLPNGRSIFEFEVRNLSVQRGEIHSLFGFLETTAGVVGEPVRDKNAEDLAIRWEPLRLPVPRTMDESIDRVRILQGSFVFGRPLRPSSDPYTFGWSVTVLNSDAATAWEFHNLYPPEKRVHVDGKKLDAPKEYFARLAWFPLQELQVEIDLPRDLSSEIRSRYFELQGTPEIPLEVIVHDGVLCSYPCNGSKWAATHAKWEANFSEEKRERPGMSISESQTNVFTVQYPHSGSYYSLEWKLPADGLSDELEKLSAEAVEIRKRLLDHRKRRREKALSPVSARIAGLVAELHEALARRFRATVPDEQFETALMTYDQKQRRLVMIDGRLNDGEMSDRSWDFWLPFGSGLAGAAFRHGLTYSYRRPDEEARAEPELYLPVPGGSAHEYLVALPLDHPELTSEVPGLENGHRCRQLVAVLTIGSTYGASKLMTICKRPGKLSEKHYEQIKALRDECQNVCDQISLLVLNRHPLT